MPNACIADAVGMRRLGTLLPRGASKPTRLAFLRVYVRLLAANLVLAVLLIALSAPEWLLAFPLVGAIAVLGGLITIEREAGADAHDDPPT